MDYRRMKMISWQSGRDIGDVYGSAYRRVLVRRVRKAVKRAVEAEIERALDEEAEYIGPHSRPGEWTAYYAPFLAKGSTDPSKGGFRSECEAWQFVFDGMCGTCRAERHRALCLSESEREESPDSLHPACACEWFVVQTDDYQRASGFEDILSAAGYVTEWVAQGAR